MTDFIKVGAGVVIIRDGQTLLAKRRGSHAQGCYGSLGGHVEFGESPVDAVKREAQEELGIEIGNIQFVSCARVCDSPVPSPLAGEWRDFAYPVFGDVA